MGRKAGPQSEPYNSIPPISKSSSEPSTPTASTPSTFTPSPLSIPDKDLESKIRAESASCIDCKIYKTMCGIHASKLKALTRTVTSPQSARSPASHFKGTSPLSRTMSGKISRTTSFTGLSSMRRPPASPSNNSTTSEASSPHSQTATTPTNSSASALSPKVKSDQKSPAHSSSESSKKLASDSASAARALIKAKSTPLASLPLHEDGPGRCPNCNCDRDADDAIFCGSCGYNYQSGPSDTSSTTTTVSNSSTNSSSSSVDPTVCKDCGATRDPPESIFCGECGYRFPGSVGGEEVQEQAF